MESSGKSNPRIVLSGHRARNKTVVMGADQLDALRADTETPPMHEHVADLLGVLEDAPEQPSSGQVGIEHQLFDGLPDSEEMVADDVSALSAQEQVLDHRVDLSDLDDDSHAFAEVEDLAPRQLEKRDGQLSSLDTDYFDELPVEEGPSPALEAVARVEEIAPEVVESFGVEQSREVSASDADGAALYLREQSDVLRSDESASHQREYARRLPPPAGNGGALVGFLVSFDADPKGMFVELREGRMIVSSEKVGAAPCLVIEDVSVSPMHAIMRICSGEPLHILDQLSEFGTRVIHADSGLEESLSGEKGVAKHGDIVLFGDKKFHVCLVSIEKGEGR
jgi:hypothetical protein